MQTDPFSTPSITHQKLRLKEVREQLHRLRLNIPRFQTAEKNLVKKLTKKRVALEEGQKRLVELEAELDALTLPPDGPLNIHSGFGI